MKKIGLIGENTDKSLSARMFNHAFKKHKVDATYVLFNVPKMGLWKALEGIRHLGFEGVNITNPFKIMTYQYMKMQGWEVTERAENLQAVNLISYQKGRPVGFNVDEPAFGIALRKRMQNPHKAVVVGDGGVARAVIQSLLREFHLAKEELYIISRNPGPLRRVFPGLNMYRPSGLPHAIMSKDVNLIVNTVEADISYLLEDMVGGDTVIKRLKKKTLFDLCYKESSSLWQSIGDVARTIHGTEMLIEVCALTAERLGFHIPRASFREGLK